MSVFKAPRGVISESEKTIRAFLWGSYSGRGKINWIDWNHVCKNKEAGGLGVGFMNWRNKALLMK